MGAFFREIQRADELGSGMRNMMKYGKAYGDKDPELIEGDVFRIIVKVPEFMGIAAAETSTPQVTEVIFAISGEMTRTELMAVLALRDRMHFSHEYLTPALESDCLEMTIPDKPKSRLQKYRLTEKGLRYLRTLEGK